VVIGPEHDGARWADPQETRAVLTDEVIATLAAGNRSVAHLVESVRDDLDRYLRRRYGTAS
jgi:hypothetical protein